MECIIASDLSDVPCHQRPWVVLILKLQPKYAYIVSFKSLEQSLQAVNATIILYVVLFFIFYLIEVLF